MNITLIGLICGFSLIISTIPFGYFLYKVSVEHSSFNIILSVLNGYYFLVFVVVFSNIVFTRKKYDKINNDECCSQNVWGDIPPQYYQSPVYPSAPQLV